MTLNGNINIPKQIEKHTSGQQVFIISLNSYGVCLQTPHIMNRGRNRFPWRITSRKVNMTHRTSSYLNIINKNPISCINITKQKLRYLFFNGWHTVITHVLWRVWLLTGAFLLNISNIGFDLVTCRIIPYVRDELSESLMISSFVNAREHVF
jgi:hypothetical protein